MRGSVWRVTMTHADTETSAPTEMSAEIRNIPPLAATVEVATGRRPTVKVHSATTAEVNAKAAAKDSTEAVLVTGSHT